MAEEIGKSNALCAAFYQYHFLQAYLGFGFTNTVLGGASCIGRLLVGRTWMYE